MTEARGSAAYLAAAIIGAAVSFGMASCLFSWSPAWLALSIGAAGGMVGYFSGEYIVEAIIFTVTLTVLLAVLITNFPEAVFLKKLLTPVVAGFCSGKLLHGFRLESSN